MTTRKSSFAILSIFTLLFVMIATGCKKDEDDTPLAETSYDLKVKDILGITGTVTFYKLANSTTIEIILHGAPSGTHPAHIHFNSAVETGGIAISLNAVDADGFSTTLVTRLDNNNSVTYEELIAFNGYVNVHESQSNLGVILAQGDIGSNALTGASKSYNLTAVDSSAVSGNVLFEKRNNNQTLITISLTGTITGEMYPAQIHLGDVNTVGGGPVVVNLNSVNGATGKSYSNVINLMNGTAITYDNWVIYDGYLNIMESAGNPNFILCQGNIGAL